MDGYLCRFTRSNIGLKVLMAITGVVMIGYLIGHVSGNMLIFAGPVKSALIASILKTFAHSSRWTSLAAISV